MIGATASKLVTLFASRPKLQMQQESRMSCRNAVHAPVSYCFIVSLFHCFAFVFFISFIACISLISFLFLFYFSFLSHLFLISFSSFSYFFLISFLSFSYLFLISFLSLFYLSYLFLISFISFLSFLSFSSFFFLAGGSGQRAAYKGLFIPASKKNVVFFLISLPSTFPFWSASFRPLFLP